MWMGLAHTIQIPKFGVLVFVVYIFIFGGEAGV